MNPPGLGLPLTNRFWATIPKFPSSTAQTGNVPPHALLEPLGNTSLSKSLILGTCHEQTLGAAGTGASPLQAELVINTSPASFNAH